MTTRKTGTIENKGLAQINFLLYYNLIVTIEICSKTFPQNLEDNGER